MRFLPFLLSLGIAFSCMPNAYAKSIQISVQRFACGTGANARYVSQSSGDGFGPTNQFVFATLTGAAGSNAGYVSVPKETLAPPSSATGFQSFSLSFIAQSNADIAASSVQFTFQNAAGQTGVITKSLNEMTITQQGQFGTATINAAAMVQPGFNLNASQSNLIKFVPYITSSSAAQIYFGDGSVQTGQGTYVEQQISYTLAPCPQVQ